MLDLNFSSVQLLSHVRLFATPWTEACQASPYITNSQNLLKLLSLELVMPSWWHFNLNLAFIKFAIENVESLNSGFKFPVVSYQFYFYHVIPLFKSFLHCPSLRNEAFLDSSCSWLGIQMLAAFLLYRDRVLSQPQSIIPCTMDLKSPKDWSYFVARSISWVFCFFLLCFYISTMQHSGFLINSLFFFYEL